MGGEAEVAERGEQGGGGERKAEGEAPIRSHGEKDKGRQFCLFVAGHVASRGCLIHQVFSFLIRNKNLKLVYLSHSNFK